MSEDQKPNCKIPECSIKADDYKCFRGELTGFDQLKQINLIIGKNNTGKSALLDLLEYSTPSENAYRDPGRSIHPSGSAATNPIVITQPFDDQLFRRCLQNAVKTHSKNHLERQSDKLSNLNMVHNIPMSWRWVKDGDGNRYRLDADILKMEILEKISLSETPAHIVEAAVHEMYKLPLQGRHVFRLIADRDLQAQEKPKPSGDPHAVDYPIVQSNGEGISLLFELFQNRDPYVHENLINEVLSALREIYGTDGDFQALKAIEFRNPYRSPNVVWGVSLQEPHKKHYIKTEDSGSGLKSVISTLAFLHLLPRVLKEELTKCIFCFEELENNLHPSVQRRLFKYLLDFTRNNGCMLFLTTHSNVAIDIFSKCSDEETQILHVKHDGTRASVDAIEPQKLGHVLDDLGYQASDILQSNYLVWVEGPSDRIYIKHALEKTGDLQEGVHYSIMFYGGRLLSHLDFDGTGEWDDEAVTELIDLAKINRNSAIILDSDKDAEEAPLNKTKKRIIEAFTDGENGKCFAWVTQGREIENYVDNEAYQTSVDHVHKDIDWKSITLDQYSQRTVRQGKSGKKSNIDKVKVARKLCENGDLKFEFDWDTQIKRLTHNIRMANGKPAK